MLACATNISSGGVALVFLANQLPGLLAKLTAPFWFHKVSYRKRMKMASLAMGLACLLVGYGGLFNDEIPSDGVQGGDENDQSSLDNNDATLARAQRGLMLELLGVSFTSFQCSLGEASLLALAGKFDGSLLPQLSSSSSALLSLDSYSAVDNDNSVTVDHAYEGLFSQEEYSENSNRHDDEQSSSLGMLMKSEKQQRKCITAIASGTSLAGTLDMPTNHCLRNISGGV